jgi:O-acetyl-ADP-ribose deacetylase (regulator of RNase III)
MTVEVITGNLLSSDATYIVHQCNCVTTKAAHLALSVFTQFPYANVYSSRKEKSRMGEIEVRGNGKDKRFVIAMFAQKYPGKSKYSNDTYEIREKAFAECLRGIEGISGVHSIAFPWQIGCGAAGGDWIRYKQMIDNFAERVEPFIEVTIVKLP